MATNESRLRVTELDFDNIKDNLKFFLKGQDKFKDYDFEGSGMSILLDTLAYNTHYMAFNANMVANEMFLDSSSLRSSAVSHAKMLGYEVTSARAPKAVVNVNLTTSDATKTLYFDLNSAAGDNSLYWNDTPPNSTVINLGTHNGLNAVNDTYVTYCWTEIEGFSKMSYFIGTGSADGPFVATGFEPRFILTKNVDRGRQWVIWDTDRSPGNYADECLFPDVIDAEATKGPDSGTDNDIDILSNGFKIRNADSAQNADGEKIIYCAFARNPFKTARAR